MNSEKISTSMCRICLEDGAEHPIFDEFAMGYSIKSQIDKCFVEKIEDQEGYPRNICSTCNITLKTLCEFIDKYRESCEILKESIVKVKTEVNYSYDDETEFLDDDFYWDDKEYVEIKIENDEIISNTNEILEKLKVPGLKITKINTKHTNDAEKEVVKKKTSKKKCIKTKAKTLASVKTMKKAKKLVEIEEKEVEKKEGEKTKQSCLCDICGAVYDAQCKLNNHLASTHSDIKFTCTICSKQFNSEYNRKRHIRGVHTDAKYICDQCSKEYKAKRLLRNHISLVHKGQRKVYKCKYCSKTYWCTVSVNIHERSAHTGIRPHVCEICNKGFFHKQYLKEHMRLHTGELPYKCPICDRGYPQHGNMKSHLRQHKMSELNETNMSKMRPCYMKCLKAC